MRTAYGVFWRSLALLCLLLCCGLSLAATPAAPDPAGKINLLTGDLQILQPGKPARAGHVGDMLYEGDLLTTGKDSEAHLAMSDSGYIVLRASSRMQIFSYKADGGEEDSGVFKLFSGAMRSITGWIGKYNRRAYLVRTPTATIGIRGTDHETRYIAPGSAEGEAGTYDKVFIGETTIQSDSGQTKVDPNQAGFAANAGAAQPTVLPAVPAFFRPGPHEDLINRKHAEIQKMIVERREERRKIVEQKRAEFQSAQQGVQQQAAANKAAGEARAAANEAQKQSTEQQVAAFRSRGEALQKSGAELAEKRKALQQQLTPALRRDAGLRSQFMAVWETGKAIAQEYAAIKEGRQAITDRNVAVNQARTTATEEQRKQADARLAELNATAEAMKQKWADLA
ncbi:MAG: FecR domain-containing protein, partial [Burkholderiaceae bacterium]|nr:FecR domain-containing protein [Burkholderiaceae bacterium]